ncbi:hypothetical protein, partial [Halobellus sp. EA9]|uniref:hypothetical protein n=1 Tax=Halobellus sp. EA9 TaxID=3421647 RepID=UPI003EB80982
IELEKVASVSPPPESESFERPPEWRPEAVVQKRSGEETEIGTPGGVDYGEVVVEGHDAIPPEKMIPPRLLRCADPMERHGIDPTECPPPELIERQMAEVHDSVASGGDARITAKQWDEDWHAKRFGEPETPDDQDGDGVLPWASIKQYREENPSATVADVLDAFGIDESNETLVGGVVGPPGESR